MQDNERSPGLRRSSQLIMICFFQIILVAASNTFKEEHFSASSQYWHIKTFLYTTLDDEGNWQTTKALCSRVRNVILEYFHCGFHYRVICIIWKTSHNTLCGYRLSKVIPLSNKKQY